MPFLQRPASRYIVLSLVGLGLVGAASVTSASKNVYNNLRTYNQILANVYDKYVDEVDSTADEAKSYAITAGAVAALVIMIVFFLIGRSRGRRSRAVVEIVRI